MLKWPRLTLTKKVFLVAALNLFLLGVLSLIFLRVQFRLDLDSFLLAPMQDRFLAVTRQLALELADTDPSGWNGLLMDVGHKYGVEFYLVNGAGNVIAGPRRTLPRRVSGQVLEFSVFSRRPPRREVPDSPAPAGVPGGPGTKSPSEEIRRSGRGEDEARRSRPHREMEEPHIFRLATESPTRHWMGLPIRLPGPTPTSAFLVVGTTSSWRSSVFFFDYKPWLTVGAAVLIISVLCWLPLVRGLTRSVSRMTRATAQIADGQFDVQLPARRRDELGQLSASINSMSERLARFVTGQKRFLGDTAHELCSPLARIQVALGILERSATAEQQRPLADLKEDVQYMSALVNEVLSFSKAGLKEADTPLEPVTIAEIAGRVVDREAVEGVKITASVEPGLRALAHPELLARAVSNVVRNAVRYAGKAGPIEIFAERENDTAVIRVCDSGPGLPEQYLEAVFEPFYRVDTARDRETGGVGLGLAIVRTCVETCQGTVRCRNRTPSGLEVEMRLKAV